MQELLKLIDATGHTGLGAVLHVGAGACRELEYFIRMKAGKILLVEPNPDLANRLQREAQSIKKVEIHRAAAVVTDEREATLHVLSNPRESTLLPPELLLQRFPNLRIARKISVPVISLARLIARVAPDPAFRNLLVLEAQGAELSLLSATPAEELRKFSWIAVRASAEPLFEGGGRADEVDALLCRSGFRSVRGPQPGGAPPFQILLYELDAGRELRQHAEIEASLKQELAEAQQAISSRAKEIGELKSELQQRAASEARLKQELAEARQAISSRAKEIGERKSELQQRAASEARLKQELVETRQTASLSTKLQVLREADLKDLQSRYGQSLSIQEKQHQMLVKVGERLKVASTVLHKMSDSQASPPGIEERHDPKTGPTTRAGSAGRKGKGGS